MIVAQEKYFYPEQLAPEPAAVSRRSSDKSRRRRPVGIQAKTALGILAIGALFIAGIAIAITYIYPTQLGYRQVSLEQELAELEKENKQIELTIAKSRSLERVETIAVSRLNMTRPESVGLMVADQSQTSQNSSSDTATASSPVVQAAVNMVANTQEKAGQGMRTKAPVED